MTPIEQALARTEIEALIAEFAWLIDHGKSQAVAELFTPDGSYGRETGQKSIGRAAIAKAYATRADAGPRTARHIFTNVRLNFLSAEEAQGDCILLLFAADGHPPLPAEPMLVQDYVDLYRKHDGRWRFASRETRRIFAAAAYRQVLPLGG